MSNALIAGDGTKEPYLKEIEELRKEFEVIK